MEIEDAIIIIMITDQCYTFLVLNKMFLFIFIT